MIRARDLAQERLRLDNPEIVDTEGTHAHNAHVVVRHHHRIRCAPFVAREQPRVEKIDISLERRIEGIFPRAQPREHRNVVGDERVPARAERVAELAEIHELRALRFTYNQLRAVLDGLVPICKAVRERVSRVVCPLDDLDVLALDEIHQTHDVEPPTDLSAVTAATSTPRCPSCGAPAAPDTGRCLYCQTRLATIGCPVCMALLFQGAAFCPSCGTPRSRSEEAQPHTTKCPSCRGDMHWIRVGEVDLLECASCDGTWIEAEAFENLCTQREQQAAIAHKAVELKPSTGAAPAAA